MEEKNITVIPARRRVGSTAAKEKVKKLRVAAYCRVSTETEEQNLSYGVQVAHYTEYIKKNVEWEFAGIFADDGISGTNTKKREEFNRMVEACMEGNIDMVITKSISRFARNTLDCLKYIRQLKEKNIAVYFEKRISAQWMPMVKYYLPLWHLLHSKKVKVFLRMLNLDFNIDTSKERCRSITIDLWAIQKMKRAT